MPLKEINSYARNVITSQGDIPVGDANGATVRLPVGAEGKALVVTGGTLAYGDAGVSLADIATDMATPATDTRESVESVAVGRWTRALYDNFSTHADGALNGVVPNEGSAWASTGSQPTTITSGKATSTDVGYAVQTFSETPTVMTCDVSFSGVDPATLPMTMSWCKDTLASGTMLNNLVHLNFGPRLFTLTVRKGGGSFDIILTGKWASAVPMDGTVAHVEFALFQDTVTVYGPNGGMFATTDRRVSDVLSGGGNTVFWEPNTSGTEQAFLHEASAFVGLDTGRDIASLQPHAVNAVARSIGADGQLYGNHYGAAEMRIGRDPSSDLPSITFGAVEVRTYLHTATSIGATTFKTPEVMPPGTVLTIGYGSTSETLTQNGSYAAFDAGTGMYTITTTGAATKAHAAGVPVIGAVPSSGRVTMSFNASAGFFYLPDKLMVVQNSAGFYFGDLTSRVYQNRTTELGVGGNLFVDGGILRLAPIALPATCDVGQMCIDTADKKLKLCTAINTWTVVGSQS